MGDTLIFDYMHEDTLCSHVEVDFKKQEVTCVNYTDVVWWTVFGLNPVNMENLMKFFERRCFSRNRPDVDVLCELLGVKGYNPVEIVKKTHGKMWNSFSWIRFEGETMTWEEMKNEA